MNPKGKQKSILVAIQLGFLALVLSLSMPAMAIVGGEDVPPLTEFGDDHPAHFNTVAIVHKHNSFHKIFCTGSIISENLILTAKHCIAEREIDSFIIYFGHSTKTLLKPLERKVTKKWVYKTNDWTSFFPNMDVAFLQFEGGIPNRDGRVKQIPHFRPLEILRDADKLQSHLPMFVAGFGNQNPDMGEIIAGDLKYIDIQFKEYLNNPFFHDLLLLEAKDGQGACHGDSGGPAYVRIEDTPGNFKWYLTGITNGFDLAVTPKTLVKTEDPMFPLKARCDSGQILYGFAGRYVRWIEQESGQQLASSAENQEINHPSPKILDQFHSFKDWCEGVQVDHPAWLTVRDLLIRATKIKPDEVPERDIFFDCEIGNKYVQQLESITYNPEDDLGTLEPLKMLPNLRSLTFKNRALTEERLVGLNQLTQLTHLEIRYKVQTTHFSPNGKLEGILSSIQQLAGLKDTLTNLTIFNSQLENINGVEEFTKLVSLNLDTNRLQSIAGLAQMSHSLEKLNIDHNSLRTLNGIETHTKLRSLNVSNNELMDIELVENCPDLYEFLAQGNSIEDISALSKNKFPRLGWLNLSGNPIKDATPISGLTSIVKLTIGATLIEDLDFLEGLFQLHTLSASNAQIKHLDVFKKVGAKFTNLSSISLSLNQIQDARPLAHLPGLKALWMTGNPILKNTDAENYCPNSEDVIEPLKRACDRYISTQK